MTMHIDTSVFCMTMQTQPDIFLRVVHYIGMPALGQFATICTLMAQLIQQHLHTIMLGPIARTPAQAVRLTKYRLSVGLPAVGPDYSAVVSELTKIGLGDALYTCMTMRHRHDFPVLWCYGMTRMGFIMDSFGVKSNEETVYGARIGPYLKPHVFFPTLISHDEHIIMRLGSMDGCPCGSCPGPNSASAGPAAG